jgi:hypothetical protein
MANNLHTFYSKIRFDVPTNSVVLSNDNDDNIGSIFLDSRIDYLKDIQGIQKYYYQEFDPFLLNGIPPFSVLIDPVTSNAYIFNGEKWEQMYNSSTSSYFRINKYDQFKTYSENDVVFSDDSRKWYLNVSSSLGIDPTSVNYVQQVTSSDVDNELTNIVTLSHRPNGVSVRNSAGYMSIDINGNASSIYGISVKPLDEVSKFIIVHNGFASYIKKNAFSQDVIYFGGTEYPKPSFIIDYIAFKGKTLYFYDPVTTSIYKLDDENSYIFVVKLLNIVGNVVLSVLSDDEIMYVDTNEPRLIKTTKGFLTISSLTEDCIDFEFNGNKIFYINSNNDLKFGIISNNNWTDVTDNDLWNMSSCSNTYQTIPYYTKSSSRLLQNYMSQFTSKASYLFISGGETLYTLDNDIFGTVRKIDMTSDTILASSDTIINGSVGSYGSGICVSHGELLIARGNNQLSVSVVDQTTLSVLETIDLSSHISDNTIRDMCYLGDTTYILTDQGKIYSFIDIRGSATGSIQLEAFTEFSRFAIVHSTYGIITHTVNSSPDVKSFNLTTGQINDVEEFTYQDNVALQATLFGLNVLYLANGTIRTHNIDYFKST